MIDLPENRLLVALDVPSAERAVRLATDLLPHVGGFKIGLELLSGAGPGAIGALVQLGKPVFVDAKLHDIPTTVQRAAHQLGKFGARWVTAHGLGGRAMLEAAVAGLSDGAGDRPAGILAVTVLTSLDDAALAAMGVSGSVGRLTARLARLAADAGCEGVVCSPRELGVVAEVAPGLRRVVPGIRPTGTDPDDQVRSATPEEAMGRGADLLVVGRAITRAADPAEAAARISAAMSGARDGT